MKGAGDHDLTRLYDGAKASRTEGVALALVNPAASGGRAGRLWPRLLADLRSKFPELTHRYTEGPGSATVIAREWCQAHPDATLLVAGGDGSVHEVVNGAVSAGPFRLGVIPLGSGNDFARNVGLPLDPAAAVRRLSAASRPIDLGQVSFHAGDQRVTRVFLNSLSLGMSVRANALARRSSLIPRGRLRYGLAGLRAAWTATAERYEVTSGAIRFDGMALNLTVANGPSFGGGMQISPDSSLSDGVLELIVIRPMRWIRRLAALARLQQGSLLELPELSAMATREPFRVTAGAGSRLVEVDGEELLTAGPLTIEVLPGRVTLLS